MTKGFWTPGHPGGDNSDDSVSTFQMNLRGFRAWGQRDTGDVGLALVKVRARQSNLTAIRHKIWVLQRVPKNTGETDKNS